MHELLGVERNLIAVSEHFLKHGMAHSDSDLVANLLIKVPAHSSGDASKEGDATPLVVVVGLNLIAGSAVERIVFEGPQ